MRIGLLMAGLMAPWLSGCPSHLSTARTYAEAGRHEIAVHYLAGRYRTEGGPEARAELVRGLENAIRTTEADFEESIGKKRDSAALGAATRLEDLAAHSRSLGLSEFAAHDFKTQVKRALALALQNAVTSLDQAEADGRPVRELIGLLRTALALDPHNPELARRYDRARASQRINLALKPDSRARDAGNHRLFLDHLAQRLSEERREFIELTDPASGIKNTELTVYLTSRATDSGWRRTKSGRAEKAIEVKNKYKECKLDSRGKKVTRVVRATYQVFSRDARAEVQVKVRIQDLRPGGQVLFEASERLTETDRRGYVTWTGDQRALAGIIRVGTDRTPPIDKQKLSQRATEKLADRVAKQILGKLEGAGR